MYFTSRGSQAYPLVLVPGYQVSSTFGDGVVAAYTPSLPELLLGLGGFAITGVIVVVALKFLGFLPERMDKLSAEPDSALAAAAH